MTQQPKEPPNHESTESMVTANVSGSVSPRARQQGSMNAIVRITTASLAPCYWSSTLSVLLGTLSVLFLLRELPESLLEWTKSTLSVLLVTSRDLNCASTNLKNHCREPSNCIFMQISLLTSDHLCEKFFDETTTALWHRSWR